MVCLFVSSLVRLGAWLLIYGGVKEHALYENGSHEPTVEITAGVYFISPGVQPPPAHLNAEQIGQTKYCGTTNRDLSLAGCSSRASTIRMLI